MAPLAFAAGNCCWGGFDLELASSIVLMVVLGSKVTFFTGFGLRSAVAGIRGVFSDSAADGDDAIVFQVFAEETMVPIMIFWFSSSLLQNNDGNDVLSSRELLFKFISTFLVRLGELHDRDGATIPIQPLCSPRECMLLSLMLEKPRRVSIRGRTNHHHHHTQLKESTPVLS